MQGCLGGEIGEGTFNHTHGLSPLRRQEGFYFWNRSSIRVSPGGSQERSQEGVKIQSGSQRQASC